MKILNTTAFAFAVTTTFVVSQFVGAPARAAEDLTKHCGNFEIAAGQLTGVYTGQWRRESDGFLLPHTLVVTDVTGSGSATVLYAYGTAPRFNIRQPDCLRVDAKLEDGVLNVPLPQGDAIASYKVGEDGSLTATYISPNGETPGNLSLVTSGPYMSTGAVQQALTDLGYDPGPVDGAMGSRTRSAIRAFQTALNLTVDGEVSVELATALQRARQTMEETGITPADLSVFSTCQAYQLGDGELVGVYTGEFHDGYGRQNIGVVITSQTETTARVFYAWADGTKAYAGRDGCWSGTAEIDVDAMTQNPRFSFNPHPNTRPNARAEVIFSRSTPVVSVRYIANGGVSQGHVLPIEN